MKSSFELIKEFPEEICVEILARLPFRSIMKFKSVCKEWRRVIETSYFRRKFMFFHRNSSSSWSVIKGTFGGLSKEVVGFYGCERYGLPRSLDSYLPPHQLKDQTTILAYADGLVLLRTISSKREVTYRVGNPVLNQWVQLPPHPPEVVATTGLVTRVEDGVVVEYKVVFMDFKLGFHEGEAITFYICSSKTWIWISKKIICPRRIYCLNYEIGLSLNKKLHWHDEYGRTLVAHDFFAADEQQQQCQVIPFPDNEYRCFRTYTTSAGFIVYINKIRLRLKLWMLKEYTSDSGKWELMQDINLTPFGCDHMYFPITMHPFETHIIYMANRNDMTLVSIDMKTQKLKRHTKSSNHSDSMVSDYLDNVYSYANRDNIFYAQQFILPQWMGSMPSI